MIGTSTAAFEKSRKEQSDRVYREVRERDAEAYQTAVQSADGIVLNFANRVTLESNGRVVLTDGQRLALAASIEGALMSLAHRLLDSDGEA